MARPFFRQKGSIAKIPELASRRRGVTAGYRAIPGIGKRCSLSRESKSSNLPIREAALTEGVDPFECWFVEEGRVLETNGKPPDLVIEIGRS